jgi:hypothetical protein
MNDAVSATHKVRAGIWFFIAATLMVVAIRGALEWGLRGTVIAALICTLLASAVAWAIINAWPAGRWLSGMSGLVAVVYAGMLMFLGSEDVGGPWVSFPAGLALGLFGVWNLMVAAWG